ncbi:Hypothetical predicted protein [Cloeon dipterum]|uniref:Saposin B-type domain-containing protein n=1 Tax=Cloeon dipterum TaxID=197152 RepID=A0A8S1DES6_9INSE|nr:Hypothetical predicted protein [Cloeon dipterum]
MMNCKISFGFVASLALLGLVINETANRVDTDAAKAAVVQNAPEAWKDAAGTAGNICSTALNTLYAKIDSSPMPDLGFKPACKPCSFLYSTCITVELIANCPSPSNSSACTSIADSYKTCASNITAFFPPPPLQRNRP